MPGPSIRIDKWLWAVRIFKTRTQAATACRSGKVTVGGALVKPSHLLKTGETVELKWPPIVRRFLVLALAERRVSALLTRELVEEITAPEEWKTWKRAQRDPLYSLIAVREKGAGRPTKKERRDLEKIGGD